MENAQICPRDTAVLQIPCPGGGYDSVLRPRHMGGRGGGKCREDPSHSQFAAPQFLDLQSQICSPYSNFKLFHSRLDFIELFTSNHP